MIGQSILSRAEFVPTPLTPEERKRLADETRAKAIADFPFELIDTRGEEAFATWTRLKFAGRGAPVVLGHDDDVDGVVSGLHLRGSQPAEEILAAAARLRHPENLIAWRAAVEAGYDEYSPPPVGEWPAQPDSMPGLLVTRGLTRKTVHIGIVPTDDWTTIPAHFCWGGWNACPPPEYHVAALRAWRDRFGAELMGLSTSCMDLRVARPPQSRADALDLAREHYVYCSDIIDQGLGTYSGWAAPVLGNEWWSFWWD